MAKWADFLVSAVRYATDEPRIEKVRVHEDRGDKVGGAFDEKRSQIVGKLEDGRSYTTIYKNEDNKWVKGEEIHTVEVDGETFIRTDKNSKKRDNLGELPEF